MKRVLAFLMLLVIGAGLCWFAADAVAGMYLVACGPDCSVEVR